MDESALWVKLFTRAGAVGTHDRVTEAIDRTRALEASGQVERCSVATWDKQVVLGDGKSGRSDRGRETLEKIEAFESWAAGRNASLYPFFEERTRGSLLTDGAETVVVLPVLCLAIYEGERLEAVFSPDSRRRELHRSGGPRRARNGRWSLGPPSASESRAARANGPDRRSPIVDRQSPTAGYRAPVVGRQRSPDAFDNRGSDEPDERVSAREMEGKEETSG